MTIAAQAGAAYFGRENSFEHCRTTDYMFVGSSESVRDNAAMESFFARLKPNVLDLKRRSTGAELRLAIVIWIERTQHRCRRQHALGRLTPLEFGRFRVPVATAARNSHPPSQLSSGPCHFVGSGRCRGAELVLQLSTFFASRQIHSQNAIDPQAAPTVAFLGHSGRPWCLMSRAWSRRHRSTGPNGG